MDTKGFLNIKLNYRNVVYVSKEKTGHVVSPSRRTCRHSITKILKQYELKILFTPANELNISKLKESTHIFLFLGYLLYYLPVLPYLHWAN